MSSNYTYTITEQDRSEFKPTYLYIKRHKVTGLKYFGKTIQKDPYKYTGSGLRWTKHIKKHGKQIETIWVHLFTDIDKLVSTALTLSELFDIVESDSWANYSIENGLDGFSTNEILSLMERKGNPFSTREDGSSVTSDRTKAGLNPFSTREDGSSLQKDRINLGIHHFITNNPSKTLSMSNKHPWQGEEHSILTSNNNKQKSSRPIYLQVKELYKQKGLKCPNGLNLKSDSILQKLLEELLN